MSRRSTTRSESVSTALRRYSGRQRVVKVTMREGRRTAAATTLGSVSRTGTVKPLGADRSGRDALAVVDGDQRRLVWRLDNGIAVVAIEAALSFAVGARMADEVLKQVRNGVTVGHTTLKEKAMV